MAKIETRPSGAHRWTKCQAAPLFASKAGPQPETDEAREGTCAAWVAELVLNGQAIHASDLLNETHANGWEVDADMVGHVQDYVDMIRQRGGQFFAERFVRLSNLVGGTLDNGSLLADGHLFIDDLKYGFRLIEPTTEQLVIYGAALAAELQQQGVQITKVTTGIFQPRGHHAKGIHRQKEWSLDHIFARATWIAECAERCHQPNPTATPGAHCLYCDGATACHALTASVEHVAAVVISDLFRPSTAAEIADRLVRIREVKKLVEAAAAALESEALSRHKSGDRLPGWQMVTKPGRRRLAFDREAVKALTGIDPVKEVPMTIGDLKAAKINQRDLALITETPDGGSKLEPIDLDDLKDQFKGL